MRTLLGIIALAGVVLTLIAAAPNQAPLGPDTPLPDMAQRAQLLRFGMPVTPDPAQNPIDPPERFTGIHAAVDTETTPEEAAREVPVTAVCKGSIAQSGFVEGYGGLAVQRCVLNRTDVTVLYGHLLLDSLVAAGTTVSVGQKIGVLAPAQSYDSGYTRKHLHLGIHQGRNIDIRGYVTSEEALKEFLDPKTVLGI